MAASTEEHTWQKVGENTRKSADSKPPTQPPMKCPECASSRIWRDGFRYKTRTGEPIQRYLCRDCALRFSESTKDQVKVNIPSKHKGLKQSPSERKIICPPGHNNKNVKYAFLAGTKNLAEVESRIEKRAAGATPDIKGKLVEYSWYLKKQGYADVDDGLESTIPIRTRMLKHLVHLGANLYDPENVKEIIALQKWKEGTKANYKYAYESFLKMEGLTWTAPKYIKPESLPFVPYEEEIDILINACGRKVSIFLQGLKETGADPGELWRAEWTDINEKTRTIDIRHPVKRHNTRVLPISIEWLGRLELLRNNNSERIFAMTIGGMRSNFDMQRRRKANDFKNPRLKKVTFTSIRHWKATVEYHKTMDILHVKQLLGHKSIRNTMIYIDIERALYGSDHNAEYISRAATSVKGARTLIEAGFEYVTEMSGYKLFRKRK